MKTAIEEKDEQISNLNSINEDLKIYIDRLEKSTTLLHSGKDISEVKRKERTLKHSFPMLRLACGLPGHLDWK